MLIRLVAKSRISRAHRGKMKTISLKTVAGHTIELRALGPFVAA
jgi:hypothetical protein